MKTFSFECEYTLSEADWIEAESIEEARELIAEAYYACNSDRGYSVAWDSVTILSLELENEDDERVWISDEDA
jgi:hypothetical protein